MAARTAPSDARRPLDDEVLADYVAAEDALRAFTDRNFGRMCAICARWTLFAARTNEAARQRAPAEGAPCQGAGPTPANSAAQGPAPIPARSAGAAGQPAVAWRLSSWVTNCCNANHALGSMSETSLAGIVASREEGREWWLKVKRAAAAPCRALTETGCYLTRGRPELCNKYFCEAVRDYLWWLGGDELGAHLAGRLDELQRRWAMLYGVYQRAVVGGGPAVAGGNTPSETPHRPPARSAVRKDAAWESFFPFLRSFDAAIARCARPVTPEQMAERLFKVAGERALYQPFFERELAAIAGHVRRPDPEAPR